MHDAVHEFVASLVPVEPVAVLDIGGRDLNGTNRDAFPSVTEWVSVDLRPGPAVDIVADAADLDLGRTFDVVVCTEVLEHAERWAEIVGTAADHLTSGGLFIVTCAGPGRAPHSGIEATGIQEGEYYANVSADDLSTAMERAGFGVYSCSQNGLDTQGVAWKA